MDGVDHDARLHTVCDAGRHLSPVALRTWTDAFARHCPSGAHRPGSTWARAPAG